MVSITIMAIIMAVVIARHDKFNGAILLRSQAYEIALQLREVQLSAVSATSRSGNYRSNLGIHFDTSIKNSYIVFQDGASGVVGRYDSGEQLGAQGVLDPRFEIRAIRRGDNQSALSNVSISFARPDFDAVFTTSAGSLGTLQSVLIEVGRVGATGNATDVVRYVEVTASGQITVKTANEL